MLLDAASPPFPTQTYQGELAPGARFAGHRIEAVAGRGGMGVVYRARQLSLERTVALKVIAPALTQDLATRRRFVRESRMAASIDHPNVIPIFYAGEEDGTAFLAMRFVDGQDLRTLVRAGGPLAPGEAARVVAQVAAALDAAHAAGLVHRDVKPANVLVGHGGHIYLTDFGLTKHARSDTDATRPGTWVGTLDFAAPEQIRGERVDARADVYALGCLLHYALTGRAPFGHAGGEGKLWGHLSEPPPRVSETGVPEAFDAVVARALAKAAEDRYRSAGDLARAALAAAGATVLPECERTVAVGAAAPTEIETRTASVAPRPRRRAAHAALALLLPLIGAAAALALRPRPSHPRPATGPHISATVRIGGRPNAMAAAGGHLWLGDFQGRRLRAFDPRTAKPVPGLRPNVGIGVEQLRAVGPVLYVLISRRRKLLRLDARTGRPLAPPIALPPDATAFTASRDTLWVAVRVQNAGRGDALLRIDARTGRIRSRYAVRDSIGGLELANGALWMVSPRPATLVRFDLKTGERRWIQLEGGRPGRIVAAGGALWVTLTDTDQVARVDARTGNVATVAVGRAPVGIAVRGGHAWVADRASSSLTRIDVATNRPTAEVLVPTNPSELVMTGADVWTGSLATGTAVRVTDPGA